MRKIIPLLMASILSSVGGSSAVPNYIGFPSISLSSIIPIDSGMSGLPGKTSKKSEVSLIETTSLSIHSAINYSSSSTSMPTNEDYFSCPRYGPFSLSNLQDVDVTFTYELYSISSQSVIERMRILKDGSVVASYNKKAISYTTGQRNNVTFTIPITNYWTQNGLELRFEIVTPSYAILKAYSSTFYPPKNSQISAPTLKSELYTSKCLGFYGNGIEMCEFKEMFDFRNIGDYLDNDYYYRLDVSRNYFLYPNDFALIFKSAKLRFNDSEYLFRYYTHKNNGDIEIPLTIEVNNNRARFGFNNLFYVNKRTLDISDEYQPGWASTYSFYLPINGRKKFNGKTIYIDLEELGYDKISTTIPLKFELNRTIVGVCTDGDYCVVGGDR